MASGRCPTTKRPFRPRVIYCITRDMEFVYQEFQFPSPNQANLCFWCACAHEGGDSWNDFRQEAGWRRTTLPSGQLQARFEHPLFQVQGVNAQDLKLDVLHVLDFGVSCHVVGICNLELKVYLGFYAQLVLGTVMGDHDSNA